MIGIAVLVLSGCSSESLAKTEAKRDFADMIDGIIQEAEAGGAGDEQLAILRNAQAEGVVSIEDARAAARAMVQCVKDAGSDAFVADQTMESGVVLPAYNYLADTPEQAAIGDACDAKEAFWVNGAYQMQPSSLALNDAYLDQQAPVVRSCLEREGYEVDADVSTHDLLRRAAQVKVDTQSGVDCLAEAGIESF
ncbi:hypothetical protein LGT39_01195 [Demequina sp. TTPB684]|uniref:hypothetical protein n=1 Tax=unclassified Demequina TaxID=2620311 RepID=UPI001CF1FEDB|nr:MULTISPECIES: hypothetical protein [unclassified Demequina]MCB2411462.1 hypothetical protein [Demequina sp. TTPB684]UPU88322.1 hypothetical protein LGT36_013965 [Demequina sp. TMPB413]